MITVIFPGSFKPLHAGHIDLIKRYIENSDVKELKILIGPGIRDNITQNISFEIANILLKDIKKISVIKSSCKTPITETYNFINAAEPGVYAMAGVNKGTDYKRVTKIVKEYQPNGKYFSCKPENVSIIELLVNTEPIIYINRDDEFNGKPISATILRQDLANNDFEKFKTNYINYNITTIQKIWKILKRNEDTL